MDHYKLGLAELSCPFCFLALANDIVAVRDIESLLPGPTFRIYPESRLTGFFTRDPKSDRVNGVNWVELRTS